MSVRFESNFDDIKMLEKKMARLPNKMETVTNKTLHTHGIKVVKDEITSVLPKSKPRKRKIPHVHARDSDWSRGERQNLAITVKSKGGAANKLGSYGYLVFPNEGRGRSNPIEQRFMEKGLERAVPKILKKLNENIDKVLKEEF